MEFFDFAGTVFGFILVLGIASWALRFAFFDGKGGLTTGSHQHYSREDRTCAAGCVHHKPSDTIFCPKAHALHHKVQAERDPAKPCPKCNRNHFADKCPPYPKAHRVTDGRTGEVIGYWTPRQ